MSGPQIQRPDHFVQFFAGETSLTKAVTGFVERGLLASYVCIVIATEAHRTVVEANLARDGFRLPDLIRSRDYVSIDANSLLHQFFHNGSIDRGSFLDRSTALLTQATSTGRPVRIFAEMAALLAELEFYAAAVELEEMWNELGRVFDFNMFCAYPYRILHRPGCHWLGHRINAIH
jgi:MEDS: MEthanogen/methylotroph, DcmR Sensory domain